MGEQAATIMRIRSMRDVSFDARWDRLKVSENFEVTLEKQSIAGIFSCL